ncbi:hypothetical protein D8N71_24535 [Salmonella enterica]|nr:hypothetical protein [Salmonella enterica]
MQSTQLLLVGGSSKWTAGWQPVQQSTVVISIYQQEAQLRRQLLIQEYSIYQQEAQLRRQLFIQEYRRYSVVGQLRRQLLMEEYSIYQQEAQLRRQLSMTAGFSLFRMEGAQLLRL